MKMICIKYRLGKNTDINTGMCQQIKIITCSYPHNKILEIYLLNLSDERFYQ